MCAVVMLTPCMMMALLTIDVRVRVADVFDVYIDKNQRVWLVDLNVFSPVTDGLLFAWPELQRRRDTLAARAAGQPADCNGDHGDADDEEVELRILPKDAQGIRPSAATASATPIDEIDITTAEGLMQLIQLQQQQQQRRGSSDSSESDDGGR